MMSSRADLRFRRRVDPSLNGLYQSAAMESALGSLGILSDRVHATKVRSLFERTAKHARVVRNLARRPGRPRYIVQILRRSEGDIFPLCYFNEVIPWSFDCWPYEYDEWEGFYRRIRVRLAFISARDSVAEMQRRLPDSTFVWSPEAVDPAKYHPEKRLLERGTTLLELGRKYEAFHALAAPTVMSIGARHLFQPTPTQKIFGPLEEDLAVGMGDSQISVCYPASVTNPEWARGLETVTYRYFQSIASKCLIFGESPQELVDLFGYDPVIKADLKVLDSQLRDLVENMGDYQSLVDRNYDKLLEVGTWEVRARDMLKAVDEVFPASLQQRG